MKSHTNFFCYFNANQNNGANIFEQFFIQIFEYFSAVCSQELFEVSSKPIHNNLVRLQFRKLLFCIIDIKIGLVFGQSQTFKVLNISSRDATIHFCPQWMT